MAYLSGHILDMMAEKISDAHAFVMDVDGTLCSLSKGVGDLYAEVLRSQGFAADASVLNAVAAQVWKGFRNEYLNTAEGYRTTVDREERVWLAFARKVLCDAGLSQIADQPDVVRCIYSSFASGGCRRVSDGATEFLRTARLQGKRLFAATNNDVRSKVVLAELGLQDHLDGVFVAGELGWKKPSSAFFEEISRRLNVSAPLLVHVGNDRELDVDAAITSGWQAILYAHAGSKSPHGGLNFIELTRLVKGQ